MSVVGGPLPYHIAFRPKTVAGFDLAQAGKSVPWQKKMYQTGMSNTRKHRQS